MMDSNQKLNHGVWIKDLRRSDFIFENLPAGYKIGLANIDMNLVNMPSFDYEMGVIKTFFNEGIYLRREWVKSVFESQKKLFQKNTTREERTLIGNNIAYTSKVWHFIKPTMMWRIHEQDGSFAYPLGGYWNPEYGGFTIHPGTGRLPILKWKGYKNFDALVMANTSQVEFKQTFNSIRELSAWHPHFKEVAISRIGSTYIPHFYFYSFKQGTYVDIMTEDYLRIRNFWLDHRLDWGVDFNGKAAGRVFMWEGTDNTRHTVKIRVSSNKHIPQAIYLAPLYEQWQNEHIKITRD